MDPALARSVLSRLNKFSRTLTRFEAKATTMTSRSLSERGDVSLRRVVRVFAGVGVATLVAPCPAQASLLSPELEDTLATILALVVIFVVPIVLIVLFWMVHILPEKIAHKRHHPQRDAIQTLCLLSLVFGGLLWPIAWIWAYTKPVGHKLAYGTDKHPDFYKDPDVDARDALSDLRDRVGTLGARGMPAGDLEAIRADLASLEARIGAGPSEGRVG
jgi:Protein of unknown function (DUF3302)